MPGFEILVSGIFNREHVHISYKNSEGDYPHGALDFMERVWLRRVCSGVRLFDGKLFRVVSYRVQGQKLFLELENTSYKYFVGSRDNEFIARFGAGMTSNPLSVGAVVLTSDNHFIIGKRRNDLDFNPGKYSVIAGIMDREKDLANGKPDPFKAMLRELSEETGVPIDQVREVLSLGLIYNEDYRQTYMPFRIKLMVPSGILAHTSPREYEFEDFAYVKADEGAVSRFLEENHERMSQTCFGNILMFGREDFGQTWLSNILSKLGIEAIK